MVIILILGRGFGRRGVIAGSMAADFQSWKYGAFTPRAGVFATLTSLGSLGLFIRRAVAFAACVAAIAALVAWAGGVGG